MNRNLLLTLFAALTLMFVSAAQAASAVEATPVAQTRTERMDSALAKSREAASAPKTAAVKPAKAAAGKDHRLKGHKKHKAPAKKAATKAVVKAPIVK